MTTTTQIEKSTLVALWEQATDRLHTALGKLNTSTSHAYKTYGVTHIDFSSQEIDYSIEEFIASREGWIEMAKEAHEEIKALEKIGAREATIAYYDALYVARRNSN